MRKFCLVQLAITLHLNDTKIAVQGLLNQWMIDYICFGLTANYLKFYKHRESKDRLDFLDNINIYICIWWNFCQFFKKYTFIIVYNYWLQCIEIIYISIKWFGKQMRSHLFPIKPVPPTDYIVISGYTISLVSQTRNLEISLDNSQPSPFTFNSSPSPVNFTSTINFGSAYSASHPHLPQSSQVTFISLLDHSLITSHLVSHIWLSPLCSAYSDLSKKRIWASRAIVPNSLTWVNISCRFFLSSLNSNCLLLFGM